jgi:hypothetical protein
MVQKDNAKECADRRQENGRERISASLGHLNIRSRTSAIFFNRFQALATASAGFYQFYCID